MATLDSVEEKCTEKEEDLEQNDSSPSLDVWSDSVQGYEHTTGFQPVYIPPPSNDSCCPPYLIGVSPPSYEEVMRDEREQQAWATANQQPFNPSPNVNMSIAQGKFENKALRISEEEANDALSKFVSSNCCYSRGLPKQMKTSGIQSSSGFQYVLETFYEERSTSWKQEPYINQVVDGPSNGVPPTGWEIVVTPPDMFKEKEIHQEVPHTASVNPCIHCKGKGTNQCVVCNGDGNIKCGVCDGLGILFRHNCQDGITGFENHSVSAPRHCHDCSGGRTTCKVCSGRGRSECKSCLGNRCIKMFICLTVKWKVLHAQKVFHHTKLPDKCIAGASGTTVFEEQNNNIYPLFDFPHNEINAYSQKMIVTHKEQVKHAQVLMQRHFVREIPIAEVLTEWKSKEFTYWVYGKEHQVYCPDYPSKCCLL